MAEQSPSWPSSPTRLFIGQFIPNSAYPEEQCASLTVGGAQRAVDISHLLLLRACVLFILSLSLDYAYGPSFGSESLAFLLGRRWRQKNFCWRENSESPTLCFFIVAVDLKKFSVGWIEQKQSLSQLMNKKWLPSIKKDLTNGFLPILNWNSDQVCISWNGSFTYMWFSRQFTSQTVKIDWIFEFPVVKVIYSLTSF